MWIVRLALTRLWRRSSHVGILVPLFALLGFSSVALTSIAPTMQAASIQSTLSGLPYVDHTLAANFDGTNDSVPFATIEQVATAGLSDLSSASIESLVTYRPVADGKTQTFHVMASPKLADQVTLIDGRMPNACSTTKCEVVVFASDAGDPLVGQYGMTIVGHVKPTDALLTDLTVQPELSVVYSNDPASIREYEPLNGFPRTLTWAAQVDAKRINTLGTDAFLARATEQANRFSLTSARMTLRVPDSAIKTSAERSGFAKDRILSLLFGLLCAGLIGVALITRTAATDFRTDIAKLVQNGLAPSSALTLTTLTVLLPSLTGSIIGIGVALVVDQLATPTVSGMLPALSAVGLTVLLSCIVSVRTLIGRSRRLHYASALVVITVLGLISQQLHLDVWALVISIGGLALAIGAASRIGARSRASVQSGLTLNNRPQLLAITALMSMVCTLAFAMLSSISGLDRNITDTAQFTSPTSFRITGLGRAPLHAVTLSEYQALMGAPAADKQVFGIKKVATTAKSSVTLGMPVSTIGLNSELIPALPNLHRQTGTSNDALAGLVRNDLGSLGEEIPSGKRISLATDALNSTVDVIAWFMNPERESESVTLTGDAVQTGDLSSVTAHSTLIGFELRENPDDLARRQHAMGEGNVQVVAPNGTAVLHDLRVDGHPISLHWSAFAQGSDRSATPTSLTAAYNLDQTSLYLSNVTKPTTINAIVDPDVASHAHDGALVLTLPGGNPLPLNVINTMDRFPTATPHFALVDSNTLDHVLAATDPAAITVSEIWLTQSPTQAARTDVMTTAQYAHLVFTSQSEILEAGKADPIRKWTLRAQLISLGALLALVALIMQLMTRTITARTSWLALEAQGVGPRAQQRALRRVLIQFSVMATACALVVGSVASNFISTHTRFNYGGDVAVPPLTASTPWLWIYQFVAGLLVTAVLMYWLTSRRTFAVKSGYEVKS